MNPEDLERLLAVAAAETPERSPPCPDEHEVAGYVDGALDGPASEALERHAADCGHCLALIGLLSRERGAVAVEASVPAATGAARARAAERSQRRWRLAPRWAMAATLVLAVPLLLQLGRDGDIGADGQGPAGPATRTRTVPGGELQVLLPPAGAAVEAGPPVFRWTEMPGSPFYDVRILTDDGDVVARARVPGTSWQPPPQVVLEPGAEYYVLVDAYPAGDRAVSSEHVPFRVPE